MHPRRSGAKNKRQAKKEYAYDAKRAHVRGGYGRGRTNSDARIHRHEFVLPRKRKRTFVCSAMQKMRSPRKKFACAAFCGA